MTIYYAQLTWTGINLVQEQDSQLESPGVGLWVPTPSTGNCTLARSTTNPDTGLADLQITSTAGGTCQLDSGSFPVNPLTTYSVKTRMRAGTTGRTCTISPKMLLADGVTPGSTVVLGSGTDNNAGYTDIAKANFTTASNDRYGYLHVEIAGTAAAEVHRLDSSQWNVGSVSPAFTTGYGGVFDYYELQCDDGDGYKTIAQITSPSILTVDYYSNKRNALASFRIRYVLVDGSPSAWTAVATLTVPMSDCGLLFVSDFDPTLNLALTDLGDREYTFLDADGMSYTQFHGRDYQAKQQPTEYRGDRFTNTVMLYAEPGYPVPAATKGRKAFSPILATAKASDVPYITVLTEDGDRWYAGLRVPSGIRQEQGGFYTVPVEVTETYGDPVPLDVTV